MIWEFFSVVEENVEEREKLAQKDLQSFFGGKRLVPQQTIVEPTAEKDAEHQKHIIQLLDAENQRIEKAEDVEYEMNYSEHYSPANSPTKAKGIAKPKVFDVTVISDSKRNSMSHSPVGPRASWFGSKYAPGSIHSDN